MAAMFFKYISATDKRNTNLLENLEAKLGDFYNQEQSKAYFEQAQEANQQWSPNGPHALIYKLIKKNISILDLGCGTGIVAQHLHAMPIHYTGVDWSCTALNKARSALKKDDGRRIRATFRQGSIYDTKLSSQSFDLVVSFFVIEHLTRPHHFLNEAARLVKKGGYIFLICPDYRRFGRMPSLPLAGPGSLKDKLRQHQYVRAVGHLGLAWFWKMVSTQLGAWPIWTDPTCLSEEWRPDADAVYLASRKEISEHLQTQGFVDETIKNMVHHAIQPNPIDAVILARKI